MADLKRSEPGERLRCPSIAAACGADRDLVTAGALLHDIGKLEAYAWDTGFTLTEAGALLSGSHGSSSTSSPATAAGSSSGRPFRR